MWHPLAVGRLLTDHGCREDVVAAGILHDVLEARLIAAADKTDNLRATQIELAKRGEETW